MAFTNEEVMRMTEKALCKYGKFQESTADPPILFGITANIPDSFPEAVMKIDVTFGMPTRIS